MIIHGPFFGLQPKAITVSCLCLLIPKNEDSLSCDRFWLDSEKPPMYSLVFIWYCHHSELFRNVKKMILIMSNDITIKFN